MKVMAAARDPASMLVCCFLLLLLLYTSCVHGEESELDCYTCSSTSADSTCYDNPEEAGNIPVTTCMLGPAQCCIIQRLDDKDNLGTPKSLYRSCMEDCDPDLVGTMQKNVDFTWVTYLTYCDKRKCNDGPGNVDIDDGGGSEVIIDGVPGINIAAVVTASVTLITCPLLLLLL